MRLSSVILITKDTIRSNTLRTILTLMGVIGGIGSIVVLISLGNGLQKITIDRISNSFTLRLIHVSKGSSEILKLSPEEVGVFEGRDDVELVSPRRSLTVTVSAGTTTESVVHAIEPQHQEFEIRNIAFGRSYQDDERGETIISTALARLLSAEDPKLLLDQALTFTIFVRANEASEYERVEKKFTVVGITDAKDDNFAMIPLQDIEDIPFADFQTIKVLASSNEVRAKLQEEIRGLGYAAESPADTVREVNAVFGMVKVMLGVLGFFALMIAAIGMFNTLTISLVERTREIGVMKAIGASPLNVWIIFLMEAILFGLFGGVLGVGSGWLVNTLLNFAISFLATKFGGDPIQLFIMPWGIAGWLVGASLLLGLFTGLYPSLRAARINPLTALRYE